MVSLLESKVVYCETSKSHFHMRIPVREKTQRLSRAIRRRNCTLPVGIARFSATGNQIPDDLWSQISPAVVAKPLSMVSSGSG